MNKNQELDIVEEYISHGDPSTDSQHYIAIRCKCSIALIQAGYLADHGAPKCPRCKRRMQVVIARNGRPIIHDGTVVMKAEQ